MACDRGVTKIQIGGVVISIEAREWMSDGESAAAYIPFEGCGKADIVLRSQEGVPRIPFGKRAFDCAPMWTLYRQNGVSLFEIFTGPAPSRLRRILVLHRRSNEADLYFTDPNPPDVDPFHGPTMELLMANYLAWRKGIIIHACGIAMAQRGILFVGRSGWGKSTLARLWAKERDVEVLSDDRIVLRKEGNRYWIYGTPWHGDAQFASPRGVRLEKIFILQQGEENRISDINGVSLVSELLTCAFPTHWDAQGMDFTLEMLSDITCEVDCQEFTFRPNRTAIDFVKQSAR